MISKESRYSELLNMCDLVTSSRIIWGYATIKYRVNLLIIEFFFFGQYLVYYSRENFSRFLVSLMQWRLITVRWYRCSNTQSQFYSFFTEIKLVGQYTICVDNNLQKLTDCYGFFTFYICLFFPGGTFLRFLYKKKYQSQRKFSNFHLNLYPFPQCPLHFGDACLD